MAQPKKSHLPDRKHAPKKTGKRLPPPEDPAEKLVTTQTEMKVGPGTLLVEQPEKPGIANGRFRVFYDKPTFKKFKEEVPLISLRFSVPLEKGHDPLLPKIAAEAHRDLSKRGRDLIRLKDIPAQHALLFISEHHATEIAALPACKMMGNIAVVERRGEGTSRKIVRLAFQLQTVRSESLAHFAEMNMGADFWLQLRDTQERLWDEED